ncbi:MAG: hypothetical protein ABIF89_01060 [bacterium]
MPADLLHLIKILGGDQISWLIPLLEEVFTVIKAWWWVPLPFIFWPVLVAMWLWWRQGLWDEKQKHIVAEIKPPEEHLKPIRAMETVMTGLWQIYSPPNWFERWWKGEFQLKFSFEIVSIDGVPRFYVRFAEKYLPILETHVYGQYPGAEIAVVDDYVKKVPQDIPNKEWYMWGTDYRLTKGGLANRRVEEEAIPIRTYTDFETEHETEEEQKIDPLAGLLQGMTQLKEGEALWVQIVACPTLGNPSDGERPWQKNGEKLRDRLAKREVSPKRKPLLNEIADLLFWGKPPAAKVEEKEVFPREMRLTPGERDTVEAIEKKISKQGFETTVRYIYLARKDAFNGSNIRIPMSYFTNFCNTDLNSIVPWGETITKIKQNWYDWFWFVKRRLYLKKRRLFRLYAMRLSPKFPLAGGTFILNTEEIASLYHFPSRRVAPASTLMRVGSRKAEAPPNLPTGE